MDFTGYDNNTKCECASGKFGVALATLDILFGVEKHQLFILSRSFYLCNVYFVPFAMLCALCQYVDECKCFLFTS